MTMMANPKSTLLTTMLTTALFFPHVVNAETQTLTQLKFGPQQEQQGDRIDGVAAIVGNDIITAKELQEIGNSRQGLERLIMEKLLLQEAKKRNITVGDTALNIALDEARQKGESVSRERLRTNLMVQKLQQQVANSLVDISDLEIDNAVEQQLQQTTDKVELIDILVEIPKSADAEVLKQAQEKTQRILAELKTGDAKSIAKTNKVIYNDLGWVELSQIPTSFAKALIDAPTNVFLQPIADRDGIHLLKVLRRQSDQETAIGATETRVSHILIKDKDNPNAKTTIDDIYTQLQGGADFAELAKQYSQDLGSAASGGSLSWARPGQMVPDFEIVMDQTGIGQMSQPFKSPFGYHILKVHERRQAQKNNREALEQNARRKIFQKRAREEWEAWLVRLRDEAYIKLIK